jgi:DNA modification methylase
MTARLAPGRAVALRGDAAALPLPDASVDLIVTSPPYWGMRSYTDGGGHYDGQIGAEPAPAGYLAALWECTREWVRVLKPGGSLFVNLGDKYAQDTERGNGGVPRKSLLGLPWRYVLGCTDHLGLILRAEIIWDKPNSLPESVTDRVRRAHEQVFHLVRQPVYYSAVDEIREPHLNGAGLTWAERKAMGQPMRHGDTGGGASLGAPGRKAGHALGRLPGSVWEIASRPLNAPAHLGVDHFAAYPPELCRRIILGWSPPCICVRCGEGQRPVVERPGLLGGDNNPDSRNGTRMRSTMDGGSREWARRMGRPDQITGYACACTPCTGHPGSGDAPPPRPAVVLDPFGGTGTTALVAAALGRTGITIDRSADYCRLACWRTTDPGERARALGLPKPPPVPCGQDTLFDTQEAS